MKAKHLIVSFSLILALLNGLLARPARAEGETRERFAMRSNLLFEVTRPIGTFESMGVVKINGRMTPGRGLIWRDDLVEAGAQTGARVSLAQMGQATLAAGARVRFATQFIADDLRPRPMLIVSLDEGSVSIRLQQGIAAHLKLRHTAFIASPGSEFRFSLREGRPVVEVSAGTVESVGHWLLQVPPPILMAATRARRVMMEAQAQAAPRRYILKPVGGINGSAVFDVRARSTRQIQVQVTDENDRPVPDVPIIFALANRVGNFSSTTASTNQNGIASIDFAAGQQAATTSFTATVQGTNFTLNGTIVVRFVPTFWTWQNAGPVFATAAAAAAVPAVIFATREDTRRIEAVGRPVISP
jgi:hypothetical protein